MALLTATMAIVVPIAAVADAPSLQRCGAIEDPEARLRCYDEVANSAGTPQAPPDIEKPRKEPSPQAEAPAEPPAAPQAPADDEGKETFTADVTRCDKGHDGRYYFFFSNGQVWKQVKASRKSYKDCSFTVTVTRDWFGYKMQRDSEERPVRISLVK